MTEYQRHLGSRASFLIPDDVEDLIQQYGNRELYARQLEYAPGGLVKEEEKLVALMELFDRYKRVLEQEVFISRGV